MNRSLVVALFLVVSSCTGFCARRDYEVVPTGPVSAGFAAGIAVMDEHLEQSILLDEITSNHLTRQMRGIIGEASTDNQMLLRLNRNGKPVWRSMTPRIGSQGIDHVFVKYNQSGTPIDMVLAESKYGSSQLGHTIDGRQMSESWRKNRLEKLGSHYSHEIADNAKIVCRKIPNDTIPNAELSVAIKDKNGKLVERKFWRESSKGEWFYSGSSEELGAVRRSARTLGKMYSAAARGQVVYRSCVCRWNISEEDLILRIDTIRRDGSILKGTKQNGEIHVLKGMASKKIPKNSISEIAKTVRRSPMFKEWSADELHQFVSKAVTSHNEAIEARPLRVLETGVRTSIAAGIGASMLDVAVQLIAKGNVDWREVGLTGVKTSAAVGVGELVGYGAMRGGVRSLRYVRGVKAAAVGIAFAAFDFYQAYKGNISYQDASMNTVGAGAGMAGGAVVGGLMMAAPACFGAAAGTGTAIGSLSGAAATNATLAFYGGGTVASGGLGMAGGAAVVGGVVTVVAVGIGVAVAWGYNAYKKDKQWKQTQEWGAWLEGHLTELPALSI